MRGSGARSWASGLAVPGVAQRSVVRARVRGARVVVAGVA